MHSKIALLVRGFSFGNLCGEWDNKRVEWTFSLNTYFIELLVRVGLLFCLLIVRYKGLLKNVYLQTECS